MFSLHSQPRQQPFPPAHERQGRGHADQDSGDQLGSPEDPGDLARRLVEAIQEVYAGGAPMSPGIATRVLTLFQKFAPPQEEARDESANLSKREKEILLLMMEGDNYHTIAEKCFLSYDTVRTHVRSIYKKLHVASVNQAIVKAFRQRLL